MESQSPDINSRPKVSFDKFLSNRRAREEVREKSPNFDSPEEKKDKNLIFKVLDKTVGLSIFMIFFGLPLFFTNLTFQGMAFEKQMYFYFMLLLGLVAWVARGIIAGEMNIRKTPLDIPIVGFWLVCLLSTIFSVDRWHSFLGAFGDPSRSFVSITSIIIAYYLISSNFSQKRLKMILTALISSGALVSLWSAFMFFGSSFLPERFVQSAPISLIGTISGLSAFLSMTVILIVLAILKIAQKNKLGRFFKKVLLTALTLNLILDLFLILAIFNFVHWWALFLGTSVFVTFILAQMMRPKKSWTWLPMALFVVVIILWKIGDISLIKANLPMEVSLGYKASWEVATTAIKNKFLIGSGPATYGYNFSLYRPQDLNQDAFYNLRFYQGSGTVFESLPTIGVVGSFFLAIILLSFLSVELYLICREREKNKLYSLGFVSATAVLLFYVLSARTEGVIYLLLALVGMVSLFAAIKESDSQENYLSLSLKASPKFALALAFIFMVVSTGVAFLFVFLGKLYIADVYAGKAAREISNADDQLTSKASKAIKFYSQEGKYYTQFGEYNMVLANGEALKGEKNRDVQKIQQYLNFSISAARQGSDMMKNDVSSVQSLAQIYENAGLYVPDSINLAIESYKRGIELDPHNPDFYQKIGQLKISMASYKTDDNEKKQLVSEAEDSFKKAVEEKNNYSPGYHQLSLAQEALGEKDAAIDNGRKAVESDPKNPNYVLALARMYQTRGSDDDMKIAEQLYKYAISLDDNDINSHFYAGLFYEKSKKKQEAKTEYNKILSLLKDGNQDLKNQINKMIDNLDNGIENTPQNLGLVNEADNGQDNSQPQNQPSEGQDGQ